MNKFFKIVSLGITLFLAILVFPKFSLAAGVLYQQSTNSATQSATLADVVGLGSFVGQKLGTGLYGTVSTTSIYMSSGGGLSSVTANIRLTCFNDSAYTSHNASCDSSSAAIVLAASTGKTLFSRATPVTFDTSKYYMLEVACSSSCGGAPGTNPEFYTYGSNSEIYPNGDFTSGYTIVDQYFVIIGDANPSIELYNVLDGGTYADFAFWQVNLFGSTQNNTDFNNSNISIFYSSVDAPNPTSTWQFVDSTNWQFPNTATHFPIAKTQSLLRRVCTSTFECFTGGGAAIGNGFWYAKAVLYANDGTELDSSAIVSFTITDEIITVDYDATSTTAVSPYALPNSTSTASLGLAYEVCGGGIDFSCGIKNAAIFTVNVLFIPGRLTNSTDFLQGAYTRFKQVFPFVVFYRLTDAVGSQLSNFTGDNTATLTLSYKLPSIPGGMSFGTSTAIFASSTVLKTTIFNGSTVWLSWWYNTILMIISVMLLYAVYSVIAHSDV